MLDASDIHVEVHGGEVRLSGAVDSQDDRLRADKLARRVSGVVHLENLLHVRRRF